MIQPRITISLPCYKRPQRTIRAIESILAQTVTDFELLITTDGDDSIWFTLMDFFRPDVLSNKGSVIFEEQTIKLYYTLNPKGVKSDIYVTLKRNPVHEGKWGTEIRNQHIQEATGKYFMFMGSDDIILPNHLENILWMIESTDLDLVCFDVWLNPFGVPRNTQFKKGQCGHSDVVFKTDIGKLVPPHDSIYGHDGLWIINLLSITDKYARVGNKPTTYHVMSLPGNIEQGID